MRNYRQWLMVAATVGIAAVVASPVAAQKKYDPGASDREIKVGNIMPYSGPASAYAEIGKTEAAYFQKINARAVSTVARSISLAMTTDIAPQKPWSRRVGSLRATRPF
jgi:hypothetical protein